MVHHRIAYDLIETDLELYSAWLCVAETTDIISRIKSVFEKSASRKYCHKSFSIIAPDNRISSL